MRTSPTGNETDLEARQHRAGLPASYRHHTWLDVERTHPTAYDLARAWRPELGSVWLSGGPGAGKTTLLCAMANELLATRQTMERVPLTVEYMTRRGWGAEQALEYIAKRKKADRTYTMRVSNRPSVRYMEGRQLDHEWRQYHRFRSADNNQADPISAVCDVGVLLWDDFSTSDASDQALDTVETVLRRRYNDRRPVIFTSNDTIAGMYVDKRWQPIASRISEMVGSRHVKLDGRDQRLR